MKKDKDYLKKYYIDEYARMKLVKALWRLEDTPFKDVAIHFGIPENDLAEAAVEFGFAHYLDEQDKPGINADAFYNSLIPVIEDEVTREEQQRIVQEAISSYQDNCLHEKQCHRCARCMKVMGSEIHYRHVNELFDTLDRILDQCMTYDVEQNELLISYTQKIKNEIDATTQIN